MAIREITLQESLALRSETAQPFLVDEYAWYAVDSDHLSAVVFIDRTDKDHGFAVLGRDPNGMHRWINGEHSSQTREEAFERLLVTMTKYEQSGETVFPQD